MTERRATLLLAGAVVLAAFSLRPALASIGPLLDDIRGGLHVDDTTAGLLTSIPPACFAAGGVAAPWLIRRRGAAAVALLAMAALAVGLTARAAAPSPALFLTCSTVALAGIGLGNVVLPVLVKQFFPDRIGQLTGLYSMSLTLGASLAAGASVPLAHALSDSWRAGLGVWALPAGIAALAWLPGRHVRRATDAAANLPAQHHPTTRLTRSPTAWALAVFFGLQASGAYIVLGWLPEILRDAGVSPGTAGLLLALTPAVGIPFAFVLPSVAARLANQSVLAAGLSAVGLVGYAGLWLAPASVPWLWSIILGISQATFPLALAMIGLRSRSVAGVARLSAFVQGMGYLISIPGPMLVGALHQHTQGWAAPLALMAGLLVIQLGVGLVAGRDRPVEEASQPPPSRVSAAPPPPSRPSPPAPPNRPVWIELDGTGALTSASTTCCPAVNPETT